MSNFAYNSTRKWINSKTRLIIKSIYLMATFRTQAVLLEPSYLSKGNTENAKERKF